MRKQQSKRANRTLADSPIAFSEVILKMPLYSWQAKILFAIEKGSTMSRVKLACVAPNGSGKTAHVVALAVLRWLYKYPRGKVICTSADSRQLDLQLMPALLKHRAVFPRWEFLSRQIRTPESGFFNAFSTDESGRAEGHHGSPETPLLIICDEAKSIPEPIYEAFDRCSYAVLLYISSPGLMQGRFYNCFTVNRPQWITIQAGLTDCPHVSQERIADVIASYGAEHPFTRSTLYGEFMAHEEGSSFAVPLKDLQALLDNPPHTRLSHSEHYAFVDFAFGGNDENVIAIRNGNRLEKLITFRDTDNMATVGRIIVELSRAGLKPSQVWGDEGGGGRVICDALAAGGWPINRFNFGAAAGDTVMYVSRGAEAWVSFGRKVVNNEIVLMRDEMLISQLTSRQTIFDMRGRTGLERKDHMRARGLKSPDRADAVVGVFYVGGGFANSINRRAYAAPSSNPMGELEAYWEGGGHRQVEESSDYGRLGLSDPGD